MRAIKDQPRKIQLADYRPPPFLIDTVDMHLELDSEVTRVRTRLGCRRNPVVLDEIRDIVLDGRDFELEEIRLDGRALTADQYRWRGETLTIAAVPDAFELVICTRLKPAGNDSGLGLFVAGGVIASQCEPEGFRRITCFPDRPDVLATWTVTLEADRSHYPVLLSNGDVLDRGEATDGRHWVKWHDPFPKPSYLFAAVAGDLASLADRHVTRSGRAVQLAIYGTAERIPACRHAMESLKRAMRWDEETYGLECDLGTYNVVALDHYAGAMENKGLNIFDVQTIVAHPDLSTDDDYMLIERIVGHEYFHNWTGNRVTCRDWFQLCLKEGITRFRDQEFSRAMSAPGEKRVETVRRLRADQFAEDAGPGAHPVQPTSFIEISNFYTQTVYDKGAELVRMLCTLLGPEAWHRGIALYLSRHDGQAATLEQYLQAMEDATGRSLRQFRLWYRQAGTPVLSIEDHWDDGSQSYRVTVRQSCPPTPGQPSKEPFHIPLALGLLDRNGNDLPARLEQDEVAVPAGTRVLEIRRPRETFEFTGLDSRPVLSLNRDFAAPVRVEIQRSDDELAFLALHDSDAVSRWDAMNTLAARVALDMAAALRQDRPARPPAAFVAACRALLRDRSDPGLAALLLTMPDENVLGAAMEVIDIDSLAAARQALVGHLARELAEDWLECRSHVMPAGPYSPDAGSIQRRRLANLCLTYLAASGDDLMLEHCVRQLRDADNLTDRLASLVVLANTDCPSREPVLAEFYERWQDQDLVVNKWLFVQATSRLPGAVERVRALMEHSAFNMRDPAKGMALLGGFCRRNYVRFHDASGAGYRLLREIVLQVDRLKPEQTLWLMPQIMQWRRFDPKRRMLMRRELEHIAATPDLSKALFETVSRALAEEQAA